MQDELASAGCVLKTCAVSEVMLASLLEACVPNGAHASVHHRSGRAYGLRGLLWSNPSLRPTLDAAGLDGLAGDLLGAGAFPIDAIFFDKTADTNWAVPGHQDRLMPVATGCVPATTIRGGIDYAEPSSEILASLVALRIHFDDVGGDTGALQVIPGSHRLGVVAASSLSELSLTQYCPCPASRGDVLAMRPLLLHRSGRRVGDGHRRVLHVVYASSQPDDPLRWRSSA
jgi:Phytanoyl-CoA dioxygenase (PhyH)